MTSKQLSETMEGVQVYRVIAEGYFLVLIGLLGIAGNLCLICWFAKKTRNFHHLMLVLSCYDTLYILANVNIFGLPNIFRSLEDMELYKRAVPVLLPIAQIGMTGSIYLTVAITIERYFTVCHPYFMFSKSWPSIIYILPIVLFSIIYNLPKFLELEVTKIIPRTGNSTTNETLIEDIYNESLEVVAKTKIEPTALRLNPVYIKIYLIYMNFIIHGIIPFITLILMNINIYRKVRQLQQIQQETSNRGTAQQREIRLTQISIAIVAVFILCHAVKWIPNIWEWTQTGENPAELAWPSWLSYVTCTSHLLTTFNCSVNFYIYFLKYRKRRQNSSSSGNYVDLPTMWTTTTHANLGSAISMTEIGGGHKSGFRDATVYKF